MSDLPLLPHPLWVHVVAGPHIWKLFCVSCELATFEDAEEAGIGVDETCLCGIGLPVTEIVKGKRIADVEFAVPCKYVTHVGLAPDIEVTPGEIEHRMFLMGTCPPAVDRLSDERIETALEELS